MQKAAALVISNYNKKPTDITSDKLVEWLFMSRNNVLTQQYLNHLTG